MSESSDTIKHADHHPHQALGDHSTRFIVGMALIAASFLVYLAYPVILLFVTASSQIKIIATVAVWAMSWAVFSVGVFLTGPEGYLRLKTLWSRYKPAHRVNK
jgi:uncharacterized membrane protein (DUF485 family)